MPNRCHVEKDLIMVKMSYFFSMSAIATVYPFFPLFLDHLGLTKTQIGLLFLLVPLLTLLKNVVVGFAADKWLCHRYVLVGSCIASAIIHPLLLTVPPSADTIDRAAQLMCHVNGSEDTWLACGPQCRPQAQRFRENDCVYICGNESYIPGSNGTETRALLIVSDPLSSFNETKASDLVVKREVLCQSFKHTSASKQACSFNENVTACNRSSTLQPVKKEEGAYSGTVTFVTVFVLMLLGSFCMSNQGMLNDAIVYNILGAKRRHRWGHSRLWGSIGYGFSSVLVSGLQEYVAQSGLSENYEPAFYACGGLSVVSGVVAFLNRATDEAAVRCGQTLHHLRQALSGARSCFFFVMVLPASILNGVWQTFSFMHLQSLGSQQLLFGVSILVTAAVEVPMFLIGGRIVKALGPAPCIYLSLVAHVVRFAGLAHIPNGWFILPLDVLHCFTFVLMYTAAATYCSMLASPSTMAAMQGLLYGVVFGLGLGLGGYIGGETAEIYGSKTLFIGCAIAAGGSLLVIVIVHEVIMSRCCPMPSDRVMGTNRQEYTEEAAAAMLEQKPSLSG